MKNVIRIIAVIVLFAVIIARYEVRIAVLETQVRNADTNIKLVKIYTDLMLSHQDALNISLQVRAKNPISIFQEYNLEGEKK